MRSNTDGSVFCTVLNTSNTPGIPSTDPETVVSDNNIHIVWVEGTGAEGEVLYRRSVDGGATFGATINLSNSPSIQSRMPEIAVSGHNVYVVWDDALSFTPLFTRSTNGGATFEPGQNLGISGSQPYVAASGNNVHVVWITESDGARIVAYARSTDGGDTFDPLQSLGQLTTIGFLTDPSVATAGDSVYVVWHAGAAGFSGLAYRRSTDGGDNFEPTVGVGRGIFLRIAAIGNNVYMVWNSGSFTFVGTDVLFRMSTDGGATFGPINTLSADIGADRPHLAVGDGRVYVVWGGLGEVLFKESTDGGVTFGPTINLTNDSGTQTGASVGTSS